MPVVITHSYTKKRPTFVTYSNDANSDEFIGQNSDEKRNAGKESFKKFSK